MCARECLGKSASERSPIYHYKCVCVCVCIYLWVRLILYNDVVVSSGSIYQWHMLYEAIFGDKAFETTLCMCAVD